MFRRILVAVLARMPADVRRAIEVRHYVRLLSRFPLERERDLAAALDLVEPGDVVVDIGANVGLWTVNLARAVGPTGRVLAFEPVPSTFAILQRTVAKLAPDPLRVALDRSAVSESAGPVRMEIPRDDRSIPNHHLARINPESGRIGVTSKTLDQAVAGTEGPIAFIKIDTEGHELAVLRGSLETLRRDRPALCIEVSTDPDEPTSDACELFRLLREIGYAPWVVDSDGWRPRQAGEPVLNCFFLREQGGRA